MDCTGTRYHHKNTLPRTSSIHNAIAAARLKGAAVIVTVITAAIAETRGDFGIDWQEIETAADLMSGLARALDRINSS